MNDPATIIAAASLGMVGLGVTSTAALKGWSGWLEVKRLEVGASGHGRTAPSPARAELADLKERVRKLEAIASGVAY